MKIFKSRNEISSFASGDSLKTSNFNGYNLGSVELSCEESERNRDSALMAKSVMSVDNLVENGGNGGVSRGANGYDAIVIGSGIGGLVAATRLAVKGARVLVLENYVIPGGSSRYFERDGYTFDVGSSVMFGFSNKVGVRLSDGREFYAKTIISSATRWDTFVKSEVHQRLAQNDYDAKKELAADEVINRLEKKLFPGLKQSIVLKEVWFNLT